MIFYFSGTGNSEHVALKISQVIGEKVYSITDCIQQQMFAFEVQPSERVGFVTPVYSLGLPTIVIDFIHKIELRYQNTPYLYYVVTFGTITGGVHYQMSELLKTKGLSLNGKYSVRMVDVWTPIFNLSDKDKCLAITRKAEQAIDTVAQKVLHNTEGNFAQMVLPHWFAQWYYRRYTKMRKTNHFYVMEDRCIGCNLCAKNCPIGAIDMHEKHPIWIKEECVMCLRCLHRCPKNAIQYGSNTLHHGQWVYPQQLV